MPASAAERQAFAAFLNFSILHFRFSKEGAWSADGAERPAGFIPPEISCMPFHAFAELDGLRATVDQVIYSPHLEAPDDRPHPFAHVITIHNGSSETVTIKGRKWVVTNEVGERVITECDGVIGKFPTLAPGERFSFQHYHAINSDSRAEGAFFGVTQEGDAVLARIPAFLMQVPRA